MKSGVDSVDNPNSGDYSAFRPFSEPSGELVRASHNPKQKTLSVCTRVTYHGIARRPSDAKSNPDLIGNCL